MSVKPNVCVMCFSDNNGGMELDTIKLARLLNGTCEVTVLCKQGSFVHQRIEREKDIEFVPIRFLSRTFSPAMLFSVRKTLKAKQVKNVIFFGASELKTLYFSFLGLDLNVIVRHGTTKSHQKKGSIHKVIYSCVNYHIALSNHLLKNVKYIVPHARDEQYKIIHPSFEFESREVNSEKSGRLKITHVGRMAEGKGQLDAVKACQSIYQAGIDFQLDLLGELGNDGYSQSLKTLIESAAYSDKIHLQGFVEDTPSFLSATDIFLFPSSGEGMPNAFIEAMHYELVCIAYENTVFPEFIEMGFYIRLVKDGDIDLLSQTLLDVASDIDNEKHRSKKNGELAKGYFQSERELSQWHQLLI